MPFLFGFLVVPPEIFGQSQDLISYRQLRWSNFQGTVGIWPEKYTGEKSDFEAFTWTNLAGNWKFKKIDSSVCQYEFTTVKGTASFYTDASWAKESTKTSQYLLKHEQGHFDITEIQARAFERDLLGEIFPCPNNVFDTSQINANTNQIFQGYVDGMRDLNLLYDDETKHGLDTKKQADWNLKFECMLQNNGPSNYCLSLASSEEQKTQPKIEPKIPSVPKVTPQSFQTFTSGEYGFSIDYPATWVVYDVPYREDNWVGIVSFSPSQESDTFFGVSIISNEYRITSLSGNQYLNELIQAEKQSCASLSIQEDGLSCGDFELIESDFFTEDGFGAYSIAFYYTTLDSMGNTDERIYLETEIPIENQAWQFVYDSSLDNWVLYSDLYAEMIGSMDIFAFEESPAPAPTSAPTPQPSPSDGGCLIATATYGSELAPQVQLLREIRDNTVMSTQSGTSFMSAFNTFYYSFAPTIADWERQNPVFKEIVKVAITPLLSSLTLLQYVDVDTEGEMLGYGIVIILLNIGMYFVAPVFVILKLKSKFHNLNMDYAKL